jgi:hypothetical protein
VVVERVEDGDAVSMERDLCGRSAPFDDALPYVNQMASFATGQGCPVDAISQRPTDSR